MNVVLSAKKGASGNAPCIVFFLSTIRKMPHIAPHMNAKPMTGRMSGYPKASPSGNANFTSPMPRPFPRVMRSKNSKNMKPAAAPTTRLTQTLPGTANRFPREPRSEAVPFGNAAHTAVRHIARTPSVTFNSSGMMPVRRSIRAMRNMTAKTSVQRPAKKVREERDRQP